MKYTREQLQGMATIALDARDSQSRMWNVLVSRLMRRLGMSKENVEARIEVLALGLPTEDL